MKTLFVLIGNGGDGSYSVHYTFNAAWIEKLDEKYSRGEFDYDDLGCDGDGFHYDTILVPDECTYESMGISDCAAEDEDD